MPKRTRRVAHLPVLPRDATPDGSLRCLIGKAAGCGSGGRCPLTPRAVAAGTMMCIEGASVDRVWYVLSGTVALVRDVGEQRGAGVPWSTRRAGTLVGDEALVQNEYADTAVALADVTACSAEVGVFRAWVASVDADAARTLMEVLIRGRSADGPRPSSAEGTAARRLARWLADECRGGVAPAFPRTLLAGLLGMLPETLSRALSSLVASGAIAVTRARIEIVDADKLLSLAEG